MDKKMTSFFQAPSLLQKPPVKRAAYSDRTAWIMAELSRLVYEPLPSEVSVERLYEEIRESIQSGDATDTVEALIRRAIDAQKEVSSETVTALRAANFRLLDSFAIEGTEAFVAQLEGPTESDGMLVLAFRGTQPGITDVLSDIRFNLVSAPGGGRVHYGFLDAFERIRDRIESTLQQYAGPPVYITGHSLGGALATLATRYLESDSAGACYTFGAPRVADDVFFRKIKTPIYRVVNAADGVPRVPFGFSLNVLLGGLRLIPINGTLAISEFIRKRFAGYTHYGHLIFLSDAPNELDRDGTPFTNLTVRISPDIFWRAQLVLRRLIATFGRAAIADHSIREYSEKLCAHARRHNWDSQ